MSLQVFTQASRQGVHREFRGFVAGGLLPRLRHLPGLAFRDGTVLPVESDRLYLDDQPINHRSISMADEKQAAQGSAAPSSKKFGEMNGTEKIKFVGKVFVFLLTAGFAYPHILQD
jgi:hypothetical protein